MTDPYGINELQRQILAELRQIKAIPDIRKRADAMATIAIGLSDELQRLANWLDVLKPDDMSDDDWRAYVARRHKALIRPQGMNNTVQ